ncbi:unnamed protein product [Choristocarpus tenellus]
MKVPDVIVLWVAALLSKPPAVVKAFVPPRPVVSRPHRIFGVNTERTNQEVKDLPDSQDLAGVVSKYPRLLEKVKDNIMEGNAGERGEEFALAQGAILLCLTIGSVPLVGNILEFIAGPGMMAGGIGLGAAGLVGLGGSLSPWPAPVDDNELQKSGAFGLMRHPTYTGLIMFALGLGVATDSPSRILLTALLCYVLDKKAIKEEAMLVEKHGVAYQDYQKAVAKFVPRVY